MKTIKLYKDPYDEGVNLFAKTTITLKPGVTVLVGCNGAGKTTMLQSIKTMLRDEKIDFYQYDNLYEGGAFAKDEAAYRGNMTLVVTMTCSSEGENIIINLGTVSESLGKWVRTHSGLEEYFILFDAIDSGLSIDNIMDVKKYLFETILKDIQNKPVYIIVSANSYEMCCGENCLDVQHGKYVTFKDYNEYREFILRSKSIKEERYKNTVEK